MNKNEIHVITTGGTIEKLYIESNGSLLNSGSIIEQNIFKKLRTPYKNFVFHHLMAKDSLELTEDDRLKICNKVNECVLNKNPCIVIHGTDTMVETGTYCENNLKNSNPLVVFTGAMKPLGFEGSDAMQNVIEAILHITHLPSGFYLSFHSAIYPISKVKKNYQTLTFEKI